MKPYHSPTIKAGFIAAITAISAFRLCAASGTEADPIANSDVPSTMNSADTWYELNDGNTYSFDDTTYVGASHAGVHLTVTSGSILNANNEFYTSDSTGASDATVTVTGEGSAINTTEMELAYDSSGTLSILDGGSVSCSGGLHIAHYASSSGTLAINGVSSGGTASSLTVSGATGTSPSHFGWRGDSEVTVSDGGQMSFPTSSSLLYMGDASSSVVTSTMTVTGVNSGTDSTHSRVYVNGWICLGYLRADASLTISDGGQVASSDKFIVCYYSNTTADTTITGSGSYLDAGSLILDPNSYCSSGDLDITIADGAMLRCSSFSNGSTAARIYIDGGYIAMADYSEDGDFYEMIENGQVYAFSWDTADYVQLTTENYLTYISFDTDNTGESIDDLDIEGYTVVTSVDNSAETYVSSATATEGTDSALVHTVKLSAQTSDLITSISLTGLTATIGTDTGTLSDVTFTNGVTCDSLSTMLTIPAGVTSFTVSIPLVDDTDYEGCNPELYILTIGSSSGIGAICDNEDQPISVSSVTDASAYEGYFVTHTVTLSDSCAADTRFSISIAGSATDTTGSATIGTDTTADTYIFTNGVTYSDSYIYVPANVASFTISVPTNTDTVIEGAETYTLTVGGVSATGTIYDPLGTEKNPYIITQDNCLSYLSMDDQGDSISHYYEIRSDVDFGDNDVVLGAVGLPDCLTITGAGTQVSVSGNLTVGCANNNTGGTGILTLEAGTILSVSGTLTDNDSVGYIYVEDEALCMADDIDLHNNGYIYIASSGYGYFGGFVAIKGKYSRSDILSAYQIMIEDDDADTTADESNLMTFYIDGTVSTYEASFLYDIFGDSVDLNGYTIICNSPLDMSWSGSTDECGCWFGGSWYGIFYYEPDYGNYFWHALHGWQYSYAGSTASGADFWDFGTNSWWYAEETDYPCIFQYQSDATSGSWSGSWYRYESGSSPNRVFYDWSSDSDLDESDLIQ